MLKKVRKLVRQIGQASRAKGQGADRLKPGYQQLLALAEDLLRLTKLNWNTAAFCCVDPITIAFSRRVGDILKMANTENPARHYRYYM